MTDLLTINGLSGGYSRQSVLHDVSLVLKQATLTALIGPNGHGKTSLLRAISGLLPVCEGEICFLNEQLHKLPPHKRSRNLLTHIPQGDMLFTEMSVEENLRSGGFFCDPDDLSSRFEEVFELFPALKDRKNQIAGSLSGGERRMVGIGRGLIQGGQILLIDEPSLGLAPAIIDQIYAALFTIKESGRTILLVEESPVRITDLADQVLLMDDGRLIWSGSVVDMQNNKSMLETYLGEVAA